VKISQELNDPTSTASLVVIQVEMKSLAERLDKTLDHLLKEQFGA
jgi:hypothetical protein